MNHIELKYAIFWRRFQATLIDAAILLPVWVLLTGWYDIFNPERSIQNTISYEFNTLLSTTLFLAYWLVMYTEYNGQTVGKRVVGIQLVMQDGSKITYGKVLLRYIATYLSITVLFLGYISVLWDKKKQGWHDKIAQTFVVNV